MSDRFRDDERPPVDARRADNRPAADASTPGDRTTGDDILRRHIEAWKATAPEPPGGLEARMLAAVRSAHESAAGGGGEHGAEGSPGAGRSRAGSWHRRGAWSGPTWAAAGALAAALAIGSMVAVRALLFVPSGPQQADRLLVADALRDAEAAEREHAHAIARLEDIARPILAKADDPELPGAQAAQLMALGNRLRFLDRTIEEINEFLQGNPGHPGVRTTLLAAYRDKTDVLRDVIAFDEEIRS